MPAARARTLSSFRSAWVKDVDTWTEKLLVDRPAALIAFSLTRAGVTQPAAPYVITVLSFGLRVASALLLLTEHFVWGAVVFFLAMISDSVDGNLSRAVFGKDPELRGTLDVAFDWVGAGLLLLALHTLFLRDGMELEATLVAAIAIVLILTEFAIATKFRLCAKKGIDPDAPSLSIQGDLDPRSSAAVRKLTHIKRAFARRGVIMVPSMVDAEFILFVVAPLVRFDQIAMIASASLFGVVMVANGVMVVLMFQRERG